MTERERYFVKQKLMGLVLIVLTVILSLIAGDVTTCVISVPIGLALIFTKEMLWVDRYFIANEE